MSARSSSAVEDAAERVYRAVVDGIISGQMPEGTWLREASLAQQIGVSRTPVREALNQLAAEGAVKLWPHRGAQVVSISDEERDSLLDLRIRFEAEAVRLAVHRMTPEHIAELEHWHELMLACLSDSEPDPQELTRLNNEFHAVFIRECGNRHLAIALQAVSRPILVAQAFRTYSPRALERSMRHHGELILAARAGDGEWAGAIMSAHILAARHAKA